MTRLALIALALVACKKEPTAPPPSEPSPPAPREVTCEEAVANPLITDQIADKLLDYCARHPGEFSQESLRCMRDAESLAALDVCGEGDAPPPQPDPGDRDRRGEAELNLDRIKAGAKALWAERAAFAIGTTPLTPATPCCDNGSKDRKCVPDASLWETSPWLELGFAIDEPHYYLISYTGTATEFTASAVGDLDCDGVAVTYTLDGMIGDGGPMYTLTKPPRAD